MKIFIASDHAGFKLKKYIINALNELNYEIEDCGALVLDPLDDYPDFQSNQRYEFFGDAILDFDLTEYLFENYPDLDEGSLTKIRSSAVNQLYLVKLGRKINIGKYLYLGKAEESTGGREKDSILEDVKYVFPPISIPENIVGIFWNHPDSKNRIKKRTDEMIQEGVRQHESDKE